MVLLAKGLQSTQNTVWPFQASGAVSLSFQVIVFDGAVTFSQTCIFDCVHNVIYVAINVVKLINIWFRLHYAWHNKMYSKYEMYLMQGDLQ